MNPGIFASKDALPSTFSLAEIPPLLPFDQVLLVPPDHYTIEEAQNPYMAGNVGSVDLERAKQQWEALQRAIEHAGTPTTVLSAQPGLADMVFCQNQTLLFRRPDSSLVCVPSRMRHESRRPEVSHFRDFFAKVGYEIQDLVPEGLCFEGGGDTLWHPEKQLLWGAFGPRSDRDVYPHLAEGLSIPILLLELVDPRFYHLDTCFMPLDAGTVLYYPEAFSPQSQDLIRAVFPSPVPVSEEDAHVHFVCNGIVLPKKRVVVQKGAASVFELLRTLGYSVLEVQTGEFLKSGGSVFCMSKPIWSTPALA